VISQTAEYALRAITFLADHEGESHTSDAISSVTKVPAGYLAKILQGMVKAGLIRSQRGPYGGFSLVISRDELTVLDVIQAVDPIHLVESCPLHLRSHLKSLCPLHHLLGEIQEDIHRRLGTVSIGSLLQQQDRDGPLPLCDFPRQQDPNAKRAVRRPRRD